MDADVQSDRFDIVQETAVAANRVLCREHYCLTLRAAAFTPATPGQFVHFSPLIKTSGSYRVWEEGEWCAGPHALDRIGAPLLRRAFSIAGLRRVRSGVEIDVIHRVVGTATRWMASLRPGDVVSCMGPLGNSFPISDRKPTAWLVAGGVGLPPMLWLAEALHRARKNTVAFCGARSVDLLPLTLDPGDPPARDARRAVRSVAEFAAFEAAVVASTDDGSAGFEGHVGSALAAYARANPVPANDVVLYTCGPERMMEGVAAYALAHGVECYVCMERNMACGTGMCQSCVVPVRDDRDAAGWVYRLCCTEGPIFPAQDIIFEPVPGSATAAQP